MDVPDSKSITDPMFDQKLDPNLTVSLEWDSWEDKFSRLCLSMNVVCGLEESPQDPLTTGGSSARPPFTSGADRLNLFRAGDGGHSAREVLDAIVAGHPAYRWTVMDGVLSILPVPGRDYRRMGHPLLERRVLRFDVANRDRHAAAFDLLANDGLAEFSPTPDADASNLQLFAPYVPVTVHLRGATFRQIFNALSKESRKCLWIFRRDDSKGGFDVTF